MSTRDTGDQQRARRPEQDDHEDAAAAVPGRSESKAQLDADVDAILDEIDEVLEENAEDFVRSFVQKGGE